jgi:hypothetical protein
MIRGLPGKRLCEIVKITAGSFLTGNSANHFRDARFGARPGSRDIYLFSNLRFKQ